MPCPAMHDFPFAPVDRRVAQLHEHTLLRQSGPRSAFCLLVAKQSVASLICRNSTTGDSRQATDSKKSKSQSQATVFKPIIPAAIRPMQARRTKVAGSENSAMPRIAVPIVPMPVQTA